MSVQPRIAIIGAGNVGGSLGIHLARSGYTVRFGVRDPQDAKVKEVLAQAGKGVDAASVREAAQGADVLFVAVPANAAVAALGEAGDVTGKVVVDCNNPLTWQDGPVHAPPPEGSITAALARAFPGARVVKAFNTFGAEFHRDPKLGGTSIDVQLAGDDKEAKALVASIATRAGFTPVDCGPLRNAAVLENLAILWIHLALREGHGRDIGFKLLKR
jgi:NADPH-dependent F420 reductase